MEKAGAGNVSGAGESSGQSKPGPPTVSPTVIISIPTQSSPRSPRLAHLRPPTSPLTPDAMRRINLLMVQEPHHFIDPSKISPISPSPSITSSITSDLGSSPRSSISIRTPSSFSWSMYRESKKSSSDFTDIDSDMCKDLFSPGITVSPAPFSPFSDQPAAISEPRLHFTFDPKSPTFLLPPTPGRTGHFLLPPPPAFGPQRERSRSDSDTVGPQGSEETSTSPASTVGSGEKLAGSDSGGSAETIFLAPQEVEGHKHLYKKRLLRKYEEEKTGLSSEIAPDSTAASTWNKREVDEKPSAPKSSRSTLQLCGSKSINLPTVQHSAPLFRCLSSLPDYGRGTSTVPWSHSGPSSPNAQSSSTPFESVQLPLLRLDEPAPTQPDFDTWLKRQLLAVNPIWYPPPGTRPEISAPGLGGRRDIRGVGPVFGPAIPTIPLPVGSNAMPMPVLLRRPSPIYPSHMYRPSFGHRSINVAPPMESLAFGRRSRSESDVAYDCQHCVQSFNSRDRLAKHLASRHKECGAGAAAESSDPNSTKSHKCSVCQKFFGRSDMLTRHMRLHTGIRPYVCHTCGQVFSRSDHLSTHQRTHTGEKPYQCPVCPYAASRRDMITRHMRTHSRSSSFAETSSTSGTGNVSVLEKSLHHTMLGESTLSEEATTASRKSSDSESDDGSGSRGSANTILCMEETESHAEAKKELEEAEREQD